MLQTYMQQNLLWLDYDFSLIQKVGKFGEILIKMGYFWWFLDKIIVSFLQCDSNVVVIQNNAFIPNRFLKDVIQNNAFIPKRCVLKYLGMKYNQTNFQMVQGERQRETNKTLSTVDPMKKVWGAPCTLLSIIWYVCRFSFLRSWRDGLMDRYVKEQV